MQEFLPQWCICLCIRNHPSQSICLSVPSTLLKINLSVLQVLTTCSLSVCDQVAHPWQSSCLCVKIMREAHCGSHCPSFCLPMQHVLLIDQLCSIHRQTAHDNTQCTHHAGNNGITVLCMLPEYARSAPTCLRCVIACRLFRCCLWWRIW